MQLKRAERWTEEAPPAPAPAGGLVAAPWLAEADLGRPVPSPALELRDRLAARLERDAAFGGALAHDLPARWPMPARLLTIAALGLACWIPVLVTAARFL